MNYQQIATEFRERAADLIAAAEAIDRLTVRPSKRGRPSNARKALNGSGAVVLASIKDGCATVKAIAADAKLKEFAARSAILALEKAGKVKRQGKGSLTRYVAA